MKRQGKRLCDPHADVKSARYVSNVSNCGIIVPIYEGYAEIAVVSLTVEVGYSVLNLACTGQRNI